MNIVDAIILLFLGLGAVIGFKRGFIKQTVIFVGTVAIVVLAFVFKGVVAIFLYENLPFLNFGGFFSGITSLNILFYEIVGFIIAFILLSIILKVVIWLSGIVEKVLKLTIILGIVSKLMGAVVGFFHYFVVLYIILFIISFPVFNIKILNESKLRNSILNNTPVLTSLSKNIVNTFDEIFELRKTSNNENKKELDKKIFDIIVKNGVSVGDKLTKLVEEGKIKISK